MTVYQVIDYRARQYFSTLASATADNFVLLEGEKWNEKDAITGLFTGRTKTGKDGVVTGTAPNQTITGTAFNSLPFDPSSGGGSGTVTNLTLSGRFIQSTNGAASAPPMSLTGTWFTGGTSTTTKPQFLIEPAGTTSASWNPAGTGWGVNAPSGFGGDLAWFGVGGSRIFSVNNVDAATVVISRENANHGIRLSRSGLNPGSCIWQVNSFGSCQFTAESSIFFNGSAVASVSFGLGNTEYIKLLNNTLLGFGTIPGNSGNASFPGLKRSGTALQVRLSDDSAYTTIDALHRLQGAVPATPTSPGTEGDIRKDGSHLYVCYATNAWVRATLSTWVIT